MTRWPGWAYVLVGVALVGAGVFAYRNAPRSSTIPTPVVAEAPTSAPAPTIPPSPGVTPGPPTPVPTPTPLPVALPAIPGVPTRPNVVLITIDTLRADHVGIYGSNVKTPNIDALARTGVRFSMAITELSQTNPSHASMFTGLYPQQHGLLFHYVDKLAENVPTLAEVLAANSYVTTGIHSWPSFDPPVSGLDRGFQVYRSTYYAVPGETDPGRIVDGRADFTTDAVIQWLREAPRTPFFLWVHYQDPHFPYTPPPPYDTPYDPACVGCADGRWETITNIVEGKLLSSRDVTRVVAAYDGEIAFTDRELGRLLDEMRATGLHDNTLYIMTGDHGEAFSENGVWFHPWVLYNTVTRVPLIVSYPKAAPQGKVVDAVVQHTDILPTVLQAAGVPVPGGVVGQSLWPLMLGLEGGAERAAVVQTLDNSSTALIFDGWKLIRDNRAGSIQLFNLRNDPKELNDLAQHDLEQAALLDARLRAWIDKYQAYYEKRL